ncbi:MAG: helix-turn-helix transcriptional regulator [Candidatus Omnitrophica bacterium]|nr:helix-turn-helix transcriptional regulator [Candidatus Omnitrophota bacterium]
MKIGSMIRQLRQDVGLTLEELSKKSGIALATLSRIENEKMTGTLDSHMMICKALGITLARLYSGIDDKAKDVDVKKDKEHTEVFVHKKKFIAEILTSKVLDKKMMPTLIKIEPDGETDKNENKLGSEKFIFVLQGEIEAKIDEEKHNLVVGDSIYFNASLPHNFKNIGAEEVQFICVEAPPSP